MSAAKLAKVQIQSLDSKEEFGAQSSLARTADLNVDTFNINNHRGKGTVLNAEVPSALKMTYGKFQSSLQQICSPSGNVVSGFNQMFQYDTQTGHRRKLKELGLPRSANDPNLGKDNGLRDITRALGPSTSAHLCFDFDGLPYRICICTNKEAQHCPAITGNLHCPGGRCMWGALISIGADSARINEQWVLNHFKWIAWKLAAQERSFPHIFGGEMLSWNRIFSQLRYRYERELIRGHKSPVWRLQVGELPSNAPMVLCVYDASPPYSTVGLTDGWYPVTAKLDDALMHFFECGRISVGDKLLIYGASLKNPLQSSAHPLSLEREGECCTQKEKTNPKPTLILNANGTRRAAWFTKLGYLRRPPSGIGLRGIIIQGGVVPCIEVVVQRSYMPLFRVVDSKGHIYILTERGEEIDAEQHARHCQDLAEIIAQKHSYDANEKIRAQQPQICAKIMASSDPERAYESLDEGSRRIVESWQTQQRILTNDYISQIVNQNPESVRKSRPFKAYFVRDLKKERKGEAFITLWGKAAATDIGEGTILRMTNLLPSQSSRSNLNLVVTDSTSIEKNMDKDTAPESFVPRKLTTLGSVAESLYKSSERYEFDIVVYIVASYDVDESRHIYACDGHSMMLLRIVAKQPSKAAEKHGVMPWSAQVGEVWAICNLVAFTYDQSTGVLVANWHNNAFGSTGKTPTIHGMSLKHTLRRLDELRHWASTSVGVDASTLARSIVLHIHAAPLPSLSLRISHPQPKLDARVLHINPAEENSYLPLILTVETGDHVFDLGLSYFWLSKMLDCLIRFDKSMVSTELSSFICRNMPSERMQVCKAKCYDSLSEPAISATVLAAGSSRAVSSTIWVDIVRICGLISLTFTLSTADWASGPFVVDISEPTHAGGF